MKNPMLPPMVKQALQLLQYPTSESPIASPPSCECVHDARLESSTNGHGESGSSLVGLTHLFACAGVAGTGSCRRAISEMGQRKRLQQALWSRSGPFIGPIISPIRAWKSLPSQTSFARIFPNSVHGGRNSNSFFGSKPPV